MAQGRGTGQAETKLSSSDHGSLAGEDSGAMTATAGSGPRGGASARGGSQTAVSLAGSTAGSDSAGGEGSGGGSPAGRRLTINGAWAEGYALVAAWVVLLVVFILLRPDTYATASNFQTIFGSQAILLVLALGVLVPLTTGDFDLSIASTLTISSMVTAVLSAQHHWPILLAILVALCAALAVGLVNGALIAWAGLDSFIVTLGMATFLAGVSLWISHSNIVSGVAPVLTEWTTGNTFLGISLDFWYGLLAALLLWYVLELTPLGRRLLFVGRSRGVARLSGLPVRRLRWGALIASALIAGVAGVMYAGQLGAADPTSGQSFLLPAFAAAFLGATAIIPGRFNAPGTFVAVYFLVSGITGLQQLGAGSFVQELFYGAALMIAVGLSHLARSRRVRRGSGPTRRRWSGRPGRPGSRNAPAGQASGGDDGRSSEAEGSHMGVRGA